MGASSAKAFTDQTGVPLSELASSKLAQFDPLTQEISFLPTSTLPAVYKTLLSSPPKVLYLSPRELTSEITAYTSHETGLCTKLNWLLASGAERLLEHGEQIKRLDFAITTLARSYPASTRETYRGLWMNEREFEGYPEGGFIYIPSFMSTSRNKSKFYRKQRVNCLILVRIEGRPQRAFEVGEGFSKYWKEEEETLFSCYNRFRVRRKSRGFRLEGELFEYGIVLETVNEDRTDKNSKVLAVLSCFGG